MVAVLQARALNALFEGDLAAVEAAATEGVRRGTEAGDLYTLQTMLLNLGAVAIVSGDLPAGKERLEEGLRIASQLGDRVTQFYFLAGFGCHAAAANQGRLAAQLLGAADTVRISAGATMIPFLGLIVGEAERRAIASIGEPRYRSEVNAGRRLTRLAAEALALGQTAHYPSVPRKRLPPEVLGTRQSEVAQLVAEGLSNKQIGARLFISERTADSHVRSILNKLGFNSRAQIAAWMASSKE
jgi:DNA-binding CsgD family transcriptional regulator